MAIMSGSCRLGIWYVQVWWSGPVIHRIRFATSGLLGEVPVPVRRYCAGHPVDLTTLTSAVIHDDTMYSRIYRAVQDIPYGNTASYGEIARIAGTSPRVVGQAMARNITPLVIPCHRVVAKKGIGGFSPSVEIKQELLAMEKKGLRKILLNKTPTLPVPFQ